MGKKRASGKADETKKDKKAKKDKKVTGAARSDGAQEVKAAESSEPSAMPEPSPATDKLRKSDYEDALDGLAVELNDMARWLQVSGQRVVVVVEGRDTAGKGGVIGAIADQLSPRQCRVVALSKPSDREKSQWYFQRYVPHLPAAGEIVLFDRSWYNRAGVEQVMGFCTEAEVQAFLKQAPVFERMLVDDGILLLKYWLTVDQERQEERFAERAEDPLKRWKLSPIDLKSRQLYAAYGQARAAMLKATHSRHAPWTLVDFNDQRRGRLTMIRHLLDRIPGHPVPDDVVDFPPLGHDPLPETFTGPLKPIKPYRLK